MNAEAFAEYRKNVMEVLRVLGSKVPQLFEHCYLGGTTPISLEDTQHAVSMDLDFHSKRTDAPVKQIFQVLIREFPKQYTPTLRDDEFQLYQGKIKIPGHAALSLDLFLGFENTEEWELRPTKLNPNLRIPILTHYVHSKLQCLEDRNEVKDWWHLFAIQKNCFRGEQKLIRRFLDAWDPVVRAEKIMVALQDWKEARKQLIRGVKSPSDQEFEGWLHEELAKTKKIIEDDVQNESENEGCKP